MRLYYGGYGHNPTGKQYAYWGGDNYKAGQNVVAPVTNHGKTYNTMFTIQATYDPDSIVGQYATDKLRGIKHTGGITYNGVNLKSLGTKDVMTLPGASQYTSKAQWTRVANARDRLLSRAVPIDTSKAQAQLLTR